MRRIMDALAIVGLMAAMLLASCDAPATPLIVLETPTPEPTATPRPAPRPTATVLPSATATALPTPTPEPTATPTATPAPTATPTTTVDTATLKAAVARVSCYVDGSDAIWEGSGVFVDYGGRTFLVTANHVVEPCLDDMGTVDVGVWTKTEHTATYRDVAVFTAAMEWGRGDLPRGLPLLPLDVRIAEIETAWMFTYREGTEVSGQLVDAGFGSLQAILVETIWPRPDECILFGQQTFGGQSGSPYIDEYGRVVAMLSEARLLTRWGQIESEKAWGEHHHTLHKALSLAVGSPAHAGIDR